MLFLTVLVAGTAVAWLIGRRRSTWQDHVRRGFGAAMIVAGLSHLGRPDPFLQHLPDWVPWPDATVFVSGIVEMALGGFMYAPARFRERVGLALAVYLVAVFPANVYVAVEGIDVQGQPDGIYPWVRLPLQALFVFLAWWSTRIAAPEPLPLPDAGRREHATR
ncbi:MAG TPA: hypothetical protein VHF27_11425 [Acidimicrobiales bacterium]|nr:hypothetical protein [Acidimicrobiales bacterium]